MLTSIKKSIAKVLALQQLISLV